MKLLIIIVAMVGAVAGAFHSYNTRNLYIQAALLSEAHTLTANVKLRVADFYLQNGSLPNDNADAGLPPARSLYGTSVKRIAVNNGGVLHVDFDDQIGRQSMQFTPEVSAVSGVLLWRCSSDSIDPDVLAKLKPECAYQAPTSDGELMYAIANDDVPRVQQLLIDGASPDAVVNGDSALLLASTSGRVDVVDALLDAGASVDLAMADARRLTPLMAAIDHQQPDVVARLLSAGASINRKDGQGLTAMDHAFTLDRRLGGDRYVLLLSASDSPQVAGTDVFGKAGVGSPLTGNTQSSRAAHYDALHSAAADCRPQRLAKMLLEREEVISPVLVDEQPINVHIRQPACTDTLLDFVADIDSYRDGAAARFATVVQACDTRDASAMLELHPWLRVTEGAGHGPTPMERAISGGCSSLVNLLIRERGLAGRMDDAYLFHAIRAAPQQAMVQLIGSLITAGADVNATNRQGQTVLGAAIAFEQPVVAKYLVDAGADADVRTLNGSWPVIEAAKKGYEHLVVQLVAHGADPNRRDALGGTALLSAVAAGRDRLVDKLLRAGANPRLKDSNGIDALVLAESRDLQDIHTLIVTAYTP